MHMENGSSWGNSFVRYTPSEGHYCVVVEVHLYTFVCRSHVNTHESTLIQTTHGSIMRTEKSLLCQSRFFLASFEPIRLARCSAITGKRIRTLHFYRHNKKLLRAQSRDTYICSHKYFAETCRARQDWVHNSLTRRRIIP